MIALKILHINCNYLGTTLHQKMLEGLDAMGYENTAFVPIYDGSMVAIEPNANVIVSKCFKKWDRLAFDYKQKKIITALEKRYDVSRCDCIHAYTLFTDGNCAMHLAEKYNKPFVVAVRNTDVNVFFKQMIHLRGRGVTIMRKASAIFFLSEAYRRQVFEKYVPERYRQELMQKSYIIPNGIDAFWFDNCRQEQLPKAEKCLRVIYAGRIDKNKNIPTTQKALAMLQQKGYSVSLTVVGKVADQQVYEQIQKDPNTKCLPPVQKEELAELYRQHDMFVMPSFTETFGLVYAEAISQGLPVVYSRGQGFDEQFPEGTVGYRADASSASSVAEAIEKIITDYNRITDGLSEHAKCFSWDKILLQYTDIYRQILKE